MEFCSTWHCNKTKINKTIFLIFDQPKWLWTTSTKLKSPNFHSQLVTLSVTCWMFSVLTPEDPTPTPRNSADTTPTPRNSAEHYPHSQEFSTTLPPLPRIQQSDSLWYFAIWDCDAQSVMNQVVLHNPISRCGRCQGRRGIHLKSSNFEQNVFNVLAPKYQLSTCLSGSNDNRPSTYNKSTPTYDN